MDGQRNEARPLTYHRERLVQLSTASEGKRLEEQEDLATRDVTQSI